MATTIESRGLRRSVIAAALLVDRGDAVRLKCCPSEDGGWLFVDETGNARRHYLRATEAGRA